MSRIKTSLSAASEFLLPVQIQPGKWPKEEIGSLGTTLLAKFLELRGAKAPKIVDHAYKQGIASWYPEPKDKEAFVLSQVYNSDYDSFTLDSYSWPKDAMKLQNV